MAIKEIVVFDTECYRDFWMIAFRNIQTGNTSSFEMYEGQPLDVDRIRKIIQRYTLIGFNSTGYDMPMLALALTKGTTTQMLKDASDGIIVHGIKPWNFHDRFPSTPIDQDLCDHIDIIEVLPGQASLKLYGGRMHSRKLQDLPIEPSASISPAQRIELRDYCINDLVTTQDAYSQVQPQLELRKKMSAEYGIDLRSKSDAQIAEVVIRSQVEQATGRKIPKAKDMTGHTFKYIAPSFIWFKSPALQEMFTLLKEHEFTVMAAGSVILPDWLSKLPIDIGLSTYKMGIGGLHSTEESVCHVADDDTFLIDRDVAAYYPNIILQMGLYPENMGKEFLGVYRKIVERRLEAKRTGDKVTDDALKITINGSFGKFGSKYSVLYAPNLLIQTTITGQLALLMLIELLEDNGFSVVSANTDGVVIKGNKKDLEKLEACIYAWEMNNGYTTEATPYRAIYSRDVNSYVALKEAGGAKLKGFFAPAGVNKNPNNQISTTAVVKYLVHGTPVEDTIIACTDVTQFLTVRTVRAGAIKPTKLEMCNDWVEDADGGKWTSPSLPGAAAVKRKSRPPAFEVVTAFDYLGKVVRWYYGIDEEGDIRNKINGYLVPRSEGAVPMMELSDHLPDDLDHKWYIDESYSILEQIGYKNA